jgi:hypothetical protein
VGDIRVKSLKKMSDRGRSAAGGIDLTDAERALLGRAVAALDAGAPAGE